MLILIRGVPGTGKSTHARHILEGLYATDGGFHIEADMYHLDHNGEYKWDRENVSKAHQWCLDTAKVYMNQSKDNIVVVSNTFTRRWEMQGYIEHAEKAGHEVDVVRMTRVHGNIHGVPPEVVQQMQERFEDYFGETIL